MGKSIKRWMVVKMLNETMKQQILDLFPEIITLTDKLKKMSKADRIYYLELIFDNVVHNSRQDDGEVLAILSRWHYNINKDIDKAQKEKQKIIYGDDNGLSSL